MPWPCSKSAWADCALGAGAWTRAMDLILGMKWKSLLQLAHDICVFGQQVMVSVVAAGRSEGCCVQRATCCGN
jgi:hypothetical protein